ncbi:hypothetical protein MLD38_030350 [Melastoma candidum]|uniref:Uncharacterized protein n=1 Tax=Melastoma candidum TaxID=119954 RepID=A0ACB9MLI3_9MYRT|nr:hypothetical protein MLD38_030350 [Melastoma candidum]
MARAIAWLLVLLPLLALSREADSSALQPRAEENFNITYIQNSASCTYRVVIVTSCSSPRHTRDQISLSFGDAYGNQIYAPRLDDPSTRTFERCSSDTFDITGPCAYKICYLYLYRSGPDGWKPSNVQVYAYKSRGVKFTYETFIPGNTWYGFNLCNTASSANRQLHGYGFYLPVMYALLLSAFLFY